MRILGVTASSYELYGAFESIASATGTGSSGTITFSSIPSTYQHLQLRVLARSTGTASNFTQVRIRLNGDTGSNYAHHSLYGDGVNAPATISGTSTTYVQWYGFSAGGNNTANIMGVGIIDIHDYASTTRNKTIRGFFGGDNNANTTGQINIGSGLWMSTNAVDSVSLILSADSFATTTQVALYGIKGA